MSPEQRDLLGQIVIYKALTRHCKGLFCSWKLGDFGPTVNTRTAESLIDKGLIRLSRETRTGFKYIMTQKGRRVLARSHRRLDQDLSR
jgi:hypothetical protein